MKLPKDWAGAGVPVLPPEAETGASVPAGVVWAGGRSVGRGSELEGAGGASGEDWGWAGRLARGGVEEVDFFRENSSAREVSA